MPDNTIKTQQDINERLLDMYYPNRNQLSLFVSENLSEEQYLYFILMISSKTQLKILPLKNV